MSRGGILIEFGGLSAEPTPFPLGTVLMKCLTLRGVRPPRAEVRIAQAGHREDLSVRPDRRGASLSGVERTIRQDCRDGLTDHATFGSKRTDAEDRRLGNKF
jgi:hypothetical protein